MLAGTENQLLDWPPSLFVFVQERDAARTLQVDPRFVVDDQGVGGFVIPLDSHVAFLATGLDDAVIEPSC